MIELAGGEYAFKDLGGDSSATGSVNLEMERFYAGAKDADCIIYNSAIDGEVRTLEELLAKSQLLADFKAVQNGEVWCTSKNFFQETTGFGLLISDMHKVFTGDTSEMHYLYRLQ
jgi:iron complex transport system substrate-binding protein